jgi:hypothetical protein
MSIQSEPSPGSPANTDSQSAKSEMLKHPRSNLPGSIVAVVITLALSIVAVLLIIRWTRREGSHQPEVVLPILFIVGVLLLLLALGTLAVVLKNHKLADKRMPMGLPDGSMRAFIALLIVVLFFIIAIFLFRELQEQGPPRILEQLTQAQVDTIPLADQLSRTRAGGTEESPLFNVTVEQDVDESVKTYSVQLLATISTLVVAVSAFYFGTSSVTTAFAAATRDGSASPSKVLAQVESIESAHAVSAAAATVENPATLLRLARLLRRSP